MKNSNLPVQRFLIGLVAVLTASFCLLANNSCAAIAADQHSAASNKMLSSSTLALAGTKFAKIEPAKGTYACAIEVGPFDLHRKYRSMEGPYVMQKVRVADLVAARKIQFPESMVTFVEGGNAISMSGGGASAPATVSMNGKSTSDLSNSSMTKSTKPMPWGDAGDDERELYWFRGLKLIVLDENNKPLPTAEFICHLNLDVDQVTRFMAFPELERSGSSRLVTLSQGQNEFFFPDGFAVPVASDEEWTFVFQAANRTTDEHRRVKHLCVLVFSKDSELKQTEAPKALHWFNPYISVVLDSDTKLEMDHHGPSCMALARAANAPNMVPGGNFKGLNGQEMTSHWAVPHGRHSYSSSLIDGYEPDLNKEDRKIHAVWSHVHPACTATELAECEGDSRKQVFKVNVRTGYAKGPELKHIDTILSKAGIPIRAGRNYQLKIDYENPYEDDLDSMASFGLFCESKTFVRPNWDEAVTFNKPARAPGESNKACDDVFCGIKKP